MKKVVGGMLDTLVFLAISGFGVTVASVSGQMVGKVLWATVVPVLIVKVVRRAVPHYAFQPEGA